MSYSIKLDKNGIPLSTNGKTLPYFDDEKEYNDLLKLPGVEKGIYEGDLDNVELSPAANRIYKFFDVARQIDPTTSKNVEIFDHVTSGFKATMRYMHHPDARVVVDKGYEYLMLPADVKVYKGMTWFHDEVPKGKTARYDEVPKGKPHEKQMDTQIWVGDLSTAAFYARKYCSGIAVYKFTSDIKLFIYNRANMEKLYDETNDAECKRSLQMLYGIRQTNTERLSNALQFSEANKHLQIYNLIADCPTDHPAQKLPYGITVPVKWRDLQNYINTYTERLGANGTILPATMSYLFGACCAEEITVNRDVVVLCRDDPAYWKNWGLDESKIFGKGPVPFRLRDREQYNINFKLSDFYLNPSYEYRDIPGQLKILSYNVHSLQSFNMNDTVELVYEKLVSFINLIKPDVLVLEEMIVSQAIALRNDCGFTKMHYVANGGRGKSLVVVAYTRGQSRMTGVEYSDRMVRNFVVIDYAGYKLVACHLEIGQRYMINRKVVWKEHFQKIYDDNVAMRKRALDKIFEYKPDIIIGDMNFSPGDEECVYTLSKGYAYDNDAYTTVHKNKVDFVFYPSNIIGVTQVIKHTYSDHYPILAQLPGKYTVGSGEMIDRNLFGEYMILFGIIIGLIGILMIIAGLIIQYYEEPKKVNLPRFITYISQYEQAPV